MLGLFRRFLNTWAARAFFLILVASFGLWGIGDVVRNFGSDTAVATIGDHRIEQPELASAYQRELNQMQRLSKGSFNPTPDQRAALAQQALDRLLTGDALDDAVARLRIGTTDEAIRQATFRIPAFQRPGGQFDHAVMLRVLAANGLTEQRFIELMRSDLGQRQLLEAVRAGAYASDLLTTRVFDVERQTRTADLVDLPFDAAPAPGEPTEAQLRRTYADDPQIYQEPAFRRIRAVVLSPETVAKTMDVSDADIAAYYQAHRADYDAPEKRSVQVVLTPDQATAQRLATAWQQGAGWPAMEAAAKAAGATAIELDDSVPADIPSPDLAKAAFAAPAGSVGNPIQTSSGWAVIDVIHVTPAVNRALDQVKQEIRDRIAASRAADGLDQRANKVQDALSAGTRLEDLPGDLGLGAVEGTLDAEGNTEEGHPAPIPGGPALRAALVAAAFGENKGQTTPFNEVPSTDGGPSSWYAVEVQAITPATEKPFDAVRDQVAETWRRDALRHAQNVTAAKLMAAVNDGQSLADAAVVAGVRVRTSPPIGRTAPPQGVPQQLLRPLFGMRVGEATMVETPEGFVVARLASIDAPKPDSDPVGYNQTRAALDKSLSDDAELTYELAERAREHPRVNRRLLDAVAAQ